MEQLAFICAHLGQRQKQCIAHWLRTLTLDLFASRCVRPLQRYLDHLSRSQVCFSVCCIGSTWLKAVQPAAQVSLSVMMGSCHEHVHIGKHALHVVHLFVTFSWIIVIARPP